MNMSGHRVLVGRLAIGLALACASGSVAAGDATRAFRIGLTATMMPGVNTNDAIAAMTVWGSEIAAREQLPLHPQTQLIENAAAVRGAVDEGRLDLVLMTTEQYVAANRPKFGEVMIGVRKGKARDEFLVLVKKGSAQRLADLKGRRIIAIDGVSYDMSMAWLDTQLITEKLESASRHFSSVEHAPKVARGVLPVYFGQADACVVTRTAFDLMVEMNPQVGTSLVPIATSPPLVHAVAVLDNRFPAEMRPRLLSALLSLHTTSRGQQALAFFGFDRLMPASDDVMAESLSVARAHERAQRGTR